MRTSLSIDFYAHRTILENIDFFSRAGIDGVCLYGDFFLRELSEGRGEALASAILERGLDLSVHAKLPMTHEEADERGFFAFIDKLGDWERQYGCVSILSFDVPDGVRDAAVPYVEYALSKTEGCAVALEDFGLCETEKRQLDALSKNPRFGHLLDIGHMYIRLTGKTESDIFLFQNSPSECPVSPSPAFSEFRTAFLSKDLPIHELHLHNNDGVTDLHRFPLDGSIPMRDIARLLTEIGFKGTVTIESAPGYAFPCFGEEADRGILTAIEDWKALCEEAKTNLAAKS